MSVVIPVRNGAATIGDQLQALAAQTYRGEWEVVVADNGSTDRTTAIVEGFRGPIPRLRVVDASRRPGPAAARNDGARAAAGDFLVFCDADDVVAPEWLASMAAAAPAADFVTGVLDGDALNPAAVRRWRPDRATGLPRGRFLPFAPSGNLGVWAEVFAATGGFNLAYNQSEDVEWSWRAQLADYSLGFAPDAVVHYRYRASTAGVAGQGFRTGFSAARLQHDFGPHGLGRPPLRRAFRQWAWLVARIPYVFDPDRRGIWVRRGAEATGRIVGSVRFGVVCL